MKEEETLFIRRIIYKNKVSTLNYKVTHIHDAYKISPDFE